MTFVGLGLFDEEGITLKGLRAAREADVVFAELYTSHMPGVSLEKLEEIIGKPVKLVDRHILEDRDAEPLIEEALKGRDVVLLIPGDPMIATTHVAIRVRAERLGIRTRIIHGPSVISAIPGLTGLQSYKFGRSTTITYPEKGQLSEAPYVVVEENRARGLHTLCLLDARAEERRFMTVREGLSIMLKLEEKLRRGVIGPDTLAVGVARAGSEEPEVRADKVSVLMEHDFGPPPHSIVFPARLHFMEAEALMVLARAPEWVREWLR